MSKSDLLLAERRAVRNYARAEFTRRLGQARIDLAPAVLKRRVVAEAQRTALSVAHQAIDIASDSRGIVAATGGALVLWLIRKPILTGANAAFNRFWIRRSTRRSFSHQTRLLMVDYWRKLKEYADG